MPMMGLARSSSVNPMAFSMARAGARWAPWVMTRLWRFRGWSLVVMAVLMVLIRNDPAGVCGAVVGVDPSEPLVRQPQQEAGAHGPNNHHEPRPGGRDGRHGEGTVKGHRKSCRKLELGWM